VPEEPPPGGDRKRKHDTGFVDRYIKVTDRHLATEPPTEKPRWLRKLRSFLYTLKDKFFRGPE
jgi:hypothetical protein